MVSESRASFKNLSIIVGLAGFLLFLYLYGRMLFGYYGPIPSIQKLADAFGRTGYIAFHVIIFSVFLLFMPFKRKAEWASSGMYIGFLIALFFEMSGIPLTMYIISPYISELGFSNELKYGVRGFEVWIGTVLTTIGIILIFIGWRRIYAAKGFVADGIYNHIRHPQYTGIDLIIIGWFIHWPTILGLMMLPLILFIYYRLSKQEEKHMEAEYGETYVEYKRNTSMFLPLKFYRH